ncbi:MAG: cell division protein ZapA [Gammaproteobacteria bacterium]|nr:cell division protein ZapA [Gammaproteobacteria bacterium]
MTEAVAVDVRILDKDYRVACSPQEKTALVNSARFLDTKMREIRSSGKIIGSERIAVMAALNIAYELLRHRDDYDADINDVCVEVKKLQDKVEHALHKTPKSGA